MRVAQLVDRARWWWYWRVTMRRWWAAYARLHPTAELVSWARERAPADLLHGFRQPRGGRWELLRAWPEPPPVVPEWGGWALGALRALSPALALVALLVGAAAAPLAAGATLGGGYVIPSRGQPAAALPNVPMPSVSIGGGSPPPGAGLDLFNALDYGAVGDGVVDDRPPIQAALTAAGVRGGGKVYVGLGVAGTFAIGPADGAVPPTAGDYSLKIPDNVVLELHPQARLVRRFAGGGNVNATVRNEDLAAGNSNLHVIGGRIVTLNAANTGKHFGFTFAERLRIEYVSFEGISLDWNVFCSDCTDVVVDRIVMDSGTALTEDGVHFEGGSRIVFSNSLVRCGDDALAIVQESNFATTDCTDVVVVNCHLESATANAIRVHAFNNMTPGNRAIRRIAISNVVGVDGASGNGIVFQDDTNSGIVSEVVLRGAAFDFANVGPHEVRGLRRSVFSQVKISNAHRLNLANLTDFTLEECETTGIHAANVQNLLIGTDGACTNIRIIGGHYSGATGTSSCLTTSGANAVTDLQVVGATFEAAAADGILLAGATAGAVIQGCRSKGNAGRGIQVLAGATLVQLAGNDVRGNTLGGILDAGTATYRRGNRHSTGAMQGRAVLVNGTVTVNTAEVLAGDNIVLEKVVGAGTTRGDLEVGTITAGTSFVINSRTNAAAISADDDSTVFWELVH